MKRKRKPGMLTRLAVVASFGVPVFVGGLHQSIDIVESWLYKPDYITDDMGGILAGGLFLGPLLILIMVLSELNSNYSSLILNIMLVSCLVLTPVWSISACILQSVTLHFYAKNPDFGVCVQRGRGVTTMYVKDSDWCRHFDREITRPSPDKRGSQR
ncbi:MULTISPECIES: hypothetical protein [Enterobacterales]|uniref:hypothetical protein n=1 Tax=Enterobacterales TaxID=91347 RepID=UPI002ED866D7